MSAEPSGAESPAPDPSGPPPASTAPSVPVSGAGHGPGPRRMAGRQMAPQECLACGQRWPCEGSWQARAEQAEAQRDRIRESSARALTRVAAGIAEQRERAERAEEKLAGIRSVLLEGGQADATARRRALGIIGGGEEADHA